MHFDDTKAQRNSSAEISIIEFLEDIPNREILGGKKTLCSVQMQYCDGVNV
jgi:hypothetical protein